MNCSMAQVGEYDPNEEFFEPPSALMYQMLDSAEIFCQSSAGTPPSMDAANHSHSNSPTESQSQQGLFPLDGFGVYLDENSVPCFVDDLGATLPLADLEKILGSACQEHVQTNENSIQNELYALDEDKITVIAEPKASYRERYSSELDPAKNRAQRFIRTEEDNKKYEYPTIFIPPKLRSEWRPLYIRVALVTTISEQVPHHCIHPYTIDTPERDVIKDVEQNCLYFRITNDECQTGEKSFHISRKKKIQAELRSHGAMRVLDKGEFDEQRVRNPQDAKQLIATYQLWKSQLVFTLAERLDQQTIPTPFLRSSAISQIMSDEAVRSPNGGARQLDCMHQNRIKCIPNKSAWAGGDEIVLILASPIKHKVFDIALDFGTFGEVSAEGQTQVDTKTIVFRTPKCDILPSSEDITVSLVIRSDRSTVTRLDFQYLTPIRARTGVCMNCQLIKDNYNATNKRRSHILFDCVTDGGESLAKSMNGLSLQSAPHSTCRPTSSTEKDAHVEGYLNQLKDALAEFIRTENPSRLFRRTRRLLLKCDSKSPPLNDAIERGHEDLARTLIEQVCDMPIAHGLLEKQNEDGHTALLMAAKFNQWNIVKLLLEKRADLAQHIDKQANNFLHLLAENQRNEMIENSLALLPDILRRQLLRGENRANQRPADVAQSRGNTHCEALLKSPSDLE